MTQQAAFPRPPNGPLPATTTIIFKCLVSMFWAQKNLKGQRQQTMRRSRPLIHSAPWNFLKKHPELVRRFFKRKKNLGNSQLKKWWCRWKWWRSGNKSVNITYNWFLKFLTLSKYQKLDQHLHAGLPVSENAAFLFWCYNPSLWTFFRNLWHIVQVFCTNLISNGLSLWFKPFFLG